MTRAVTAHRGSPSSALTWSSVATRAIAQALINKDPRALAEGWDLLLKLNPEEALSSWRSLPPHLRPIPTTAQLAWLITHPDRQERLKGIGIVQSLKAHQAEGPSSQICPA